MEVAWFFLLVMEDINMKKLIIWLKLIERKDLDTLLNWLGLVSAPTQSNKVEEQVFNHLAHREEMKLAQLQFYLRADDHQGIVNLALYI